MPGWEGTFVIPRQYSQRVMDELSTGQITCTTRRAIIQDVSAKCLNHCKYPTSEQLALVVVASKIVAAFPVLADTIGTGHVSSFHNLLLHVPDYCYRKNSDAHKDMIYRLSTS